MKKALLLSALLMGTAHAQVDINTDVNGRVIGMTIIQPESGYVTYADRYGATTGQGALPVTPYTAPANYSVYTPSPYTPESVRRELKK
jgi:hypothetical protein